MCEIVTKEDLRDLIKILDRMDEQRNVICEALQIASKWWLDEDKRYNKFDKLREQCVMRDVPEAMIKIPMRIKRRMTNGRCKTGCKRW